MSYHGSHRSPRSRRSRVLRAVAVLVSAAVGAGGGVGWYAWGHLNGNITAVDVAPVAGPRPTRAVPLVPGGAGPSGPLNVLLLGSDTREGKGNRIGGTSAGLSDTTMLVHVGGDRTWARAVSIPRDAMVHRPACRRQDGQGTDPGGLSMFNAAYAVGGPACTVATVEALSGVRVDHFVVVDFAGFKHMVDALGGVPICVPHDVDDRVGHIRLKGGSYVADGDTALDYVRERHVLSANGDLGRIKRQQAFLTAMGQKATRVGTVTNPARLYAFLDAATQSLTTDPDLASLGALAGMARQVHKVGVGRVAFGTVPHEPYPADRNRVQISAKADALWAALRTDTNPTKKATTKAGKKTPAPTATTPSAGTPKPTKTRSLEAVENGLC